MSMKDKEEITIEGPDANNDGKPDWIAKIPVPWWAAAIIGIAVGIITGTKAMGLW